jgi:hypothetical protein
MTGPAVYLLSAFEPYTDPCGADGQSTLLKDPQAVYCHIEPRDVQ